MGLIGGLLSMCSRPLGFMGLRGWRNMRLRIIGTSLVGQTPFPRKWRHLFRLYCTSSFHPCLRIHLTFFFSVIAYVTFTDFIEVRCFPRHQTSHNDWCFPNESTVSIGLLVAPLMAYQAHPRRHLSAWTCRCSRASPLAPRVKWSRADKLRALLQVWGN